MQLTKEQLIQKIRDVGVRNIIIHAYNNSEPNISHGYCYINKKTGKISSGDIKSQDTIQLFKFNKYYKFNEFELFSERELDELILVKELGVTRQRYYEVRNINITERIYDALKNITTIEDIIENINEYYE